ncbi:hypothetical protein SteCoe_28522 [Stentor coeruleus]|uniref:O-methyltransferase C-terminal domain-containing protein n=1 Tax=Stentor coeruleus TaxID=5963 RepID=A0A1R2B819_9CILI|nr:hypothetical protein SteCoe_28522 [Stentor coeruleus]
MSEVFALAGEIKTATMLASVIPVLMREKIPERLIESPRSVAELAENTAINCDRLHRFLQLIEVKGLAKYDADTKLWHSTEKTTAIAGQFANDTWSWLFSRYVQEGILDLGELLYSEKSVYEHSGKKPIFEHLKENPDLLKKFQDAMKTFTKMHADAVERGLDLEGCNKILDVGGGDGSLSIGLAKRYPDKKFGVYEIPEVIHLTNENVASEGLSQNIEAISGSMFESIPHNFDSILMKHILHDWRDNDCKTILNNCRKALTPGGKLFIIDTVVDRGHPAFSVKVFKDINMMAQVGSKERTTEEFRNLLEETGFRIEKVTSAGTDDIVLAIAI